MVMAGHGFTYWYSVQDIWPIKETWENHTLINIFSLLFAFHLNNHEVGENISIKRAYQLGKANWVFRVCQAPTRTTIATPGVLCFLFSYFPFFYL